MEDHAFTLTELIASIIGIGLTAAFGAWAAVVKRAAENMSEQIDSAIMELQRLREEMHRDRVLYERRFTLLEKVTGIHKQAEDWDDS